MSYCINCGASLEEQHRFCLKCGTHRFEADSARPASPAGPISAPFSPASPILKARQTALMEEVAPQLSLVSFLCAAGAVFWAILLTQTAAVIAAPNGRAGIVDLLARSGVAPSMRTVGLITYAALLILICMVPMALHGIAYYALKARRRSAWVMGVLLAGAWSFVLVGIPFLYILLKRDVRTAFGFV